MARPKTYTREELTDAALRLFWRNGYFNTSMDDLVTATKVSRHGVYKEFGDKKSLFLFCIDQYTEQVVTPAFSRLENEGADLNALAEYFEHQIAAAERQGLPGPGCLAANTLTEAAQHDRDISEKIDAHHARLRAGFARAIEQEAGGRLSESEVLALAELVLTFATGLWSLSRATSTAAPLRAACSQFIRILKDRCNGANS